MKWLPWEYAIRNLGRSPLRLALTVMGSALVVGLVLAAASFVRGMDRSLRVSGGADNVILMGAGSEESVERSEIKPSVGDLVRAQVPGIKTRLGVAYVSPEVHMQVVFGLEASKPGDSNTMVRGVLPSAYLVHQQVRIMEGRAPEAGRDELLVGRLSATKMGVSEGRLGLGQKLYFDKREWTIVGRFEAPGTVMESEVWCPLSDLQIAARRDNLSCVVLTLDKEAGGEFEDVDLFAKQRLDLELVAMTERSYYAKLASFYRPVQIMIWVTAGLIAMGALFGGLNTLYAAFAARIREFGSLQTIGFSRRAILLSLIQESTIATAAGALIACVLGIVVLDGISVRFSMGAFALALDSYTLMLALLTGISLGIIGALPPAYRCLKPAITETLRAT
jgi:putative ABC transport system permease protein